ILNEEHFGGGRGAFHLIAGLKGAADLAIDGQERIVIFGAADDADRQVGGNQQRPVGQGVGADRRDTDGIDGREDDGSAGRERVRGGAGGRGDDQTVGLVFGDESIARPDIEIDDAGDGGFGDDNV